MWRVIKSSRCHLLQKTWSPGSAGVTSNFSYPQINELTIKGETYNEYRCYSLGSSMNNACYSDTTPSPVDLTQENYNNSCINGISLRTCMVSCRTPLNSSNTNKLIRPLLSYSFSIRHYAKGKDRGSKGGKNKSKIDISSEEMRKVVNGEQLAYELNELIENFKEDLTKAVSIRTNIGNLEELPIELEGDTYPLNEVAQVHRKSPTLVVINCSAFPQATKSVVTAIINSGMNLNPQQEGTSVAVPIPKVTREHREGLAGKAKQLFNKCKDNLRTVHNNYVRKAKGKESQVSEDTLHKVTLKIKEMFDEKVKEAETLLSAKQTELLKSS